MYKDLPWLSWEIHPSITFFGFLALGFVCFALGLFVFFMVVEPSNFGVITVLAVSLVGPNIKVSSVLASW